MSKKDVHGTINSYNGGCRCAECKTGNTEYHRNHRRDRETQAYVNGYADALEDLTGFTARTAADWLSHLFKAKDAS